MIRRPPRSTLDRSSAASDVYKRQTLRAAGLEVFADPILDSEAVLIRRDGVVPEGLGTLDRLSLIHISEPTRPY